MLNWESLQAACLSCTSCTLSQTRHNVVFGVGPRDAAVMFVGEGPPLPDGRTPIYRYPVWDARIQSEDNLPGSAACANSSR